MGQIRAAALTAGRDPTALAPALFAFLAILDRSPGEDRRDFVRTPDEVRHAVATACDLPPCEIVFAPRYSTGDLRLDEYVGAREPLRDLC